MVCMVQLDCGLVRTEGLAPRSTEGQDCTEGRVCVGGKGFWMVDGAEGSGSDGKVFRAVDGMEGSGLDERVLLVGGKGLRL
jgi:hypothetical protein